ncbi:MAG: response regulator, partial [Deltaproteobacteria bacterium]|nr:response regulator [Deltaproteobacteria bacterium]
ERFSGIPVMMVTTEAERENVVRAIQAGANNYLCKPFSPQDLTTKVMESLGMGLDM